METFMLHSRPVRFSLLTLSSFAFASATLFSGCGGNEQFASNSATNSAASNSTSGAQLTGAEEPPSTPGKYGGTLTDDTISDPKTFNYWVAAETSSTGAVGPLFDALITRNGYTLEWEDQLADLPEISADGLTWTFKLKEGLKWSDGRPLTADDVTFTLDVIYDTKIQTNMRESMLLDVPDGKGGFKRAPLVYRKVDNRTIEFKFPVRYAPARDILSFPIAPRHKLEAAYKAGQPASTRFNSTWGVNVNVKEFVSSGAWLLQEYVPGQRLVYVRNPNYWKKDDQGRPLPYLDRFVVIIVPDTNASVLKFRAGDTDILQISQYTEYPELKRGEAKGNYKIHNTGPTWGNNYLSLNMNPKSQVARDKPHLIALFRDVRFRRAVSHAINRDRMIKNVFLGFAQQMHGPESPANKAFFNPDVTKYEYSVEKAKALLNEIGARDTNGDGIVEYKGKPVRFNILTNVENKTRIAIATNITDDLRKIGVGAIFTPINFNKLVSYLDAKPEKGKPYPPYNWESIVLGFTGGPEPNNGRSIWSSSGNLHQWYPYQDRPDTPWEAEIDRIFREGAQEMDETKRKAIYGEWQTIASEQLPLIYTIVPEGLVALRNRFGNVKPSSAGVIWNLEEMYDLKATRDTP
jgi:peptide/nickel transport system substrate-binding protein